MARIKSLNDWIKRYAAANGQPYYAVGRWLIDQGELAGVGRIQARVTK